MAFVSVLKDGLGQTVPKVRFNPNDTNLYYMAFQNSLF